MTLDNKLHEARKRLIEVENAQRVLISKSDEYRKLISKQKDAHIKLLKENKDVDKILGLSLSAFMAKIMNNREEKIKKEEREAILAKQIYDGVTYELDELKREIEGLNTLVATEAIVKATYVECLKEKKQALISNNPKMIDFFSQHEAKVHKVSLAHKEINEAIRACHQVKKTSNSALESLKKAKNWGTFDLLGGDFIATMVKRDHMEKAQTKINGLNYALKNFSKELKDIDQYTASNIEIASYFKIGDWLFDGLFVDMMVQNKIHDAINQVSRVRRQSLDYEKKLSKMLEDVEKTLEKLDQERETFIRESKLDEDIYGVK